MDHADPDFVDDIRNKKYWKEASNQFWLVRYGEPEEEQAYPEEVEDEEGGGVDS
jgi:hypothetical protein